MFYTNFNLKSHLKTHNVSSSNFTQRVGGLTSNSYEGTFSSQIERHNNLLNSKANNEDDPSEDVEMNEEHDGEESSLSYQPV